MKEQQFHSAPPGHCWSTWYSTHVVWPWQSLVPWDLLAFSFLTALPALNNTSWVLAQRTSSWLAKNSFSNSFAFPWQLPWTMANNVFHPPNAFKSNGFGFSLIWCISNGFIISSSQLSSSFSAELKQQSRKDLHLLDVSVTVPQPRIPHWSLPACSTSAHPSPGCHSFLTAQGSAVAPKPSSCMRPCWALSPLVMDILLLLPTLNFLHHWQLSLYIYVYFKTEYF